MPDEAVAAAASVRHDERRWPRPPVAVVIAIACALAVALVGWGKVLRHDRWLSAPRRIAWLAPDGKPVKTECHGNTELESLVDGDRFWVMCQDMEGFPDPVLGLIDTTRGEARVVAAFHDPVQRTSGLLPGPNDTVAIVVKLQKPEALAVGIADRSGWVRAPARLPGEAKFATEVGLLGMSFRGETLEVVVVSDHDRVWQTTPPTIVTLAPGAAPTARSVSREVLHCAEFCGLTAAYRRTGTSTWRFIVNDDQPGGLGPIDVAEDGTYEKLPESVTGLRSQEIDLTYSGVISHGYSGVISHGFLSAPKVLLLPDGRFENASFLGWSTHFVTDAGRTHVTARERRYIRSRAAVEHHVGARVLRTKHVWSAEGNPRNAGTPGYQDERLSIVDVTDPASPRETFPARLHDCTDLFDERGLAYSGVFLPREDGGFLLVSPSSGCYVTLDRDLRRTDPWGIVAHLRMRGSMYLDWNEPRHAWELGFALFGLPLALAITLAIHRLRRKPLAPRLIAAAWIYAAAAGTMLFNLWPLMQ